MLVRYSSIKWHVGYFKIWILKILKDLSIHFAAIFWMKILFNSGGYSSTLENNLNEGNFILLYFSKKINKTEDKVLTFIWYSNMMNR